MEKYNLTVTANSAKRRLRIIYFEFTPLLKSYQATKQKRRDEESAIKDEKSIGLLSGYRYFDAKRKLDETNLTDIVSTVANRSVPDAAMEIAEEIDIPNHCAYMDNDPKMKYSISTQPVFGDLIRGKLVNKVYIQLSAEARYFSIPRRERSALVLPDWVVQGGLRIVEKYDWHIFLNECLSQVDVDGSLTVNPQFKNGWRELRINSKEMYAHDTDPGCSISVEGKTRAFYVLETLPSGRQRATVVLMRKAPSGGEVPLWTPLRLCDYINAQYTWDMKEDRMGEQLLRRQRVQNEDDIYETAKSLERKLGKILYKEELKKAEKRKNERRMKVLEEIRIAKRAQFAQLEKKQGV